MRNSCLAVQIKCFCFCMSRNVSINLKNHYAKQLSVGEQSDLVKYRNLKYSSYLICNCGNALCTSPVLIEQKLHAPLQGTQTIHSHSYTYSSAILEQLMYRGKRTYKFHRKRPSNDALNQGPFCCSPAALFPTNHVIVPQIYSHVSSELCFSTFFFYVSASLC